MAKSMSAEDTVLPDDLKYSFIHAVGDYLRQTSKKEFEQKTQYFQRLTNQLNRREYKLTGWNSKFANDRTLVQLRNDSIKKSAVRGSAEIPWFLRCVHHHFHAKEVQEYCNLRELRSHEEIDEALCSLFPRVYSKCLDALLRCFYEDRTVLLRGLAQVWETGPYVFKCDKYRFVSL
ncbi:hypothetical protein FH972_018020 [Carpinus fangiana]|uniref:Uncharacterized protein n=1 Tax=Carpinus fangiana TaxID=176857 RepID=A0A5N6RM33_9ROSI|nr:hypothetical protein FH972_018020 [Carpinus fangiana]